MDTRNELKLVLIPLQIELTNAGSGFYVPQSTSTSLIPRAMWIYKHLHSTSPYTIPYYFESFRILDTDNKLYLPVCAVILVAHF